MSTNFYMYTPEPCPTCNHLIGDPIHIGKRASAGNGRCNFILSTYANLNLRNIDDWRRAISTAGAIVDEYDKRYTSNEMLAVLYACNRISTMDGEFCQ